MFPVHAGGQANKFLENCIEIAVAGESDFACDAVYVYISILQPLAKGVIVQYFSASPSTAAALMLAVQNWKAMS